MLTHLCNTQMRLCIYYCNDSNSGLDDRRWEAFAMLGILLEAKEEYFLNWQGSPAVIVHSQAVKASKRYTLLMDSHSTHAIEIALENY